MARCCQCGGQIENAGEAGSCSQCGKPLAAEVVPDTPALQEVNGNHFRMHRRLGIIDLRAGALVLLSAVALVATGLALFSKELGISGLKESLRGQRSGSRASQGRAAEPRQSLTPSTQAVQSLRPRSPVGSPSVGEAGSNGSPMSGELTLDLGNNVTMKLVFIPAGRFLMGSPSSESGRSDNEGPQHEVTITRPFYMGVFEVTQEQWKRVMGTKPWNGLQYATDGGSNAASYISWVQASEFCGKLSRKTGRTVRLPTEAEWEYACRAGSTARFCFGDSDDELGGYAWHGKNFWPWDSHRDTGEYHALPVGQKKPNAWGLYDMHGNVWEWCSDWYADSYADANSTDPSGPASGSCRVLRGGSWSRDPPHCRSASRNRRAPGGRADGIGFRLVVDLK